MKHKISRRAQSTLEYAVIIAVVAAALVAIQIYLKRGVQGKLRQSADQIGEQFEPEESTATSSTTHSGVAVQTTKEEQTVSQTTGDLRTESGKEEINAWE
jgi:Flp pilus assembly pilin Flp